jgi:hypothetical protein
MDTNSKQLGRAWPNSVKAGFRNVVKSRLRKMVNAA